jgi:serine/alanine adding enzyme
MSADSVLAVRESVSASEWTAFVTASADSTFCHQYGWRRIMEDVMRHRCLYLVAENESGIQGVLPLVHVRGLVGHFLVSMPFVNDGGPLGTPEARCALATRARHEAESTGAKLLELRVREELQCDDVRTSSRKIGVHLPLPDSVEALWSTTFKAKLRSQIRRPAKEGMTSHIGADQLPDFYAVFSRNMRDLGTPVLPRRFFSALTEQFGENVVVGVVRSAEGIPVAAAVCMIWRDEMEITWASSLREYNKQSPNMMLYAALMEHAIGRGVKTFNFGRSTPGGSTHKFKQQWGGRDVALPWADWNRASEGAIPSGDSATFALATAVWRQLPVGLTNAVGPYLARWFP